MNDYQFNQLLSRLELSWEGYRRVRKGVKKRIRKHMQQLDCKTVSAYLAELGKNDKARRECDILMSVSISRFLRDRKFWQTLEKEILPDLIREKETLKVWSAGCACGEEVYSFKIIWNRLEKSGAFLPELKLVATDLNTIYLDRARAGVYHSSSLREVKKEDWSKYFNTNTRGSRFSVKPAIKNNIVWKQLSLLADPPGLNFDIIFLRNNLFTYYQDHLKQPAFKKVLDALSPSGVLVIGSHEDLPFTTENLLPVDPHSFVFRKYL